MNIFAAFRLFKFIFLSQPQIPEILFQHEFTAHHPLTVYHDDFIFITLQIAGFDLHTALRISVIIKLYILIVFFLQLLALGDFSF